MNSDQTGEPISDQPVIESDDGLRCDACGKSLEHYTDEGMKVTLTAVKICLEASAEAIAPYVAGKAYHVCHSCLLKSLGVLP